MSRGQSKKWKATLLAILCDMMSLRKTIYAEVRLREKLMVKIHKHLNKSVVT